MSEKGYNGWSNWETWNAGLWVDNEESVYREKCRIVRRTPKNRLADALEAFVKETWPNGTPDMASEGGKRCYDAVDWEELADSWHADEYPDGEDDEEEEEEEEPEGDNECPHCGRFVTDDEWVSYYDACQTCCEDPDIAIDGEHGLEEEEECEHPNAVESDPEPPATWHCPDCGENFIVSEE
jgi:hypothetical protein